MTLQLPPHSRQCRRPAAVTPCDTLGNRGLGIISQAQGLMTGDTQKPAWSPDSSGSNAQGIPELPFTFFLPSLIQQVFAGHRMSFPDCCTKLPQLSGLKRPKCIVLQSGGQKSEVSFTQLKTKVSTVSFGDLRGRYGSLPFPASEGHLTPWVTAP